jgi:hypothetical protein
MTAPFGVIRGHSLYTRPLGDDAVIVDLGANRGEFALQMSRRFGGRYYLVEGNPDLQPNSARIPRSTCFRMRSLRRMARFVSTLPRTMKGAVF